MGQRRGTGEEHVTEATITQCHIQKIIVQGLLRGLHHFMEGGSKVQLSCKPFFTLGFSSYVGGGTEGDLGGCMPL